MSRAMIIIRSDRDRTRAANWARKAPDGCRIEFKESKRTIPQNSMLWALLGDIAKQVEHAGRHYSPEDWKCLFMHALGQEVRFLPALDGQSFVPIGYRSSDLSKGEMTELIELILSFGAKRGVVFHDQQSEAA